MYERAVLVLMGGIFGWLLGRLPVIYVYVVIAVTLVAALVVFR